MKAKSVIIKLAKLIVWIAGLAIILVLIANLVIDRLLKKNGITIQQKNIEFPSTLYLKGLDIKSDNFTLQADKVVINWSWMPLLEGKFKGKYLFISQAEIHQIAAPNSDKDTSSIELPFIDLDKIYLKNVYYQLIDQLDTLQLEIPDLRIAGLKSDGTIQIDTLINNGSQFSYASNKVEKKPKPNGKTTDSFALSDIPKFSVHLLSFNDCEFLYKSEDQVYSVRDFHFNLSGLRNNDLLDVQLNELSFVYQDTLQLDLTLDEVSLEQQNGVSLTNLDFDLPGLGFKAPHLEFSNNGALKIAVTFRDAFVHTHLIEAFFPSFQFPFPEDERIDVNGTASWEGNQLSFDQFGVSLAEHSSFVLNGWIDFGEDTILYELNVPELQTVSTDLDHLFNLGLEANQKAIHLASSFQLSGPFENLDLKGNTNLNGLPISITSKLEQTSAKEILIQLNMNSGFLDFSRLASMKETNVKTEHMSLSANAVLDSGFNLMNAEAFLTCDSLLVNDYWVHEPAIRLTKNKSTTSVMIGADPEGVKLFATTNEWPIDISDLHFSGFLESPVPQLNDLSNLVGQAYSNFEGQFIYHESELQLKLGFDSLDFQPYGLSDSYLTHGSLSFFQETNGKLGLNLSVEDQEIVGFQADSDLMDWWKQDNKWEGGYPEAALSMKLGIDSLLLSQLTGFSGSLQLDHLYLETKDSLLKAEIDLPEVQFEEYLINDLAANLSYSAHDYDGELFIGGIDNPYTYMDSIRARVDFRTPTIAEFSLTSYFPAIRQGMELSCEMEYLDDGFVIRLDKEKDLHFGSQTWRALDNHGFRFNKQLENVLSEFAIANDNQRIDFSSSGNDMHVRINSFGLGPLVGLFADEFQFHGDLNLDATYQKDIGEFSWLGSVNDMAIDSIDLGQISSEGINNQEGFEVNASLKQQFGDVHLKVNKKVENPIHYEAGLRNFDLEALNNVLPVFDKSLILKGKINGDVQGSYDEELLADGQLNLTDVIVNYGKYGVFAEMRNERIYLKNNEILLKKFEISDRQGNKLFLDGMVGYEKSSIFDLRIMSDRFTVLDANDDAEDLKGKIDLATNLNIKGHPDQIHINGFINTLPGSDIDYHYKTNIALNELEDEITFRSFDEVETKQDEKTKSSKKQSAPINWNVDMDIGNSNIYILLYESSQDYIRMTASGQLQLRPGIGNMPNVFGEIASSEGSIFYDAPMVSDVDMKIMTASAKWDGNIENPVLSFQGVENFRIEASELPGGDPNRRERLPISVLAAIDDLKLNEFAIRFDISSDNGEVTNFINKLPKDTREAYAINLLLFGRLEMEDNTQSGSTYMEGLVAKLNEISRRNIKNADLSFYADSEAESESNTFGTVNKVGYSFSKGLFHKKIRVGIGGNVDFSAENHPGSRKFNPFANIQVDYVLSETPDITINARKRNTYKGVIEGQVDESSLGITFRKRYRNFFNIFRKKE